MKHKLQPVVAIVLLLSIVLAAQSTHPALANPDTTIDTFETNQTLFQTGVGSNSNFVTGAGILGNERDVITVIEEGSLSQYVDINTGGNGYLAHSQGGDVKGYTEVQWDGNDTGASTIDPNGLGTVDLTNSGIDDYFIAALITGDFDSNLIMVFWDSSANDPNTCSMARKLLPAMSSNMLPRTILFSFSEFSTGAFGAVNCTTPADVTDVGAVALFIDGSATSATDVILDFVKVGQMDFGDHDEISPNNYHTQMEDQLDGNIFGAGHAIGNLTLGATIDGELDGQLSANSDGDDNNNTGSADDEDGVTRVASPNWVAGSATGGSVSVIVSGGDACLYGWIDWNRNGTFGNGLTTNGTVGINDRVLNGIQVSTGTNTYSFPVPSNIVWDSGPLNARFRLYPRDPIGGCSTNVSGSGTGYLKYPDRFLATNGEVEDYLWYFGPTAVNLQSFTPAGNSTLPVVAFIGFLALVIVSFGVVIVRREQHKA
jgi:hypothetical protein